MPHDLVVIGGGPGGYATAFRAAARGLDVALVERDRVGGTCLHRGCIPSKANLEVAGLRASLGRSAEVGLVLDGVGFDGAALDRFRRGVVDRLHRGLAQLAAQRCAAVHHGTARLVEPGVVEVVGAGGERTRVAGRTLVIATGSTPRQLPGVPVDGEVVLTSDEALWFLDVPPRAVIIGAGAVGVEFAAMWQPFGAAVTLVEALDRVLPAEDPDSSAVLERALRRAGVQVLTGAKVESVTVGATAAGHEATVEVSVDGAAHRLEADVVLVAVGRDPRPPAGAAELGLVDDRGYVVTDALGRTPVDGIWAVGDVRGGPALAHAAFAQGFAVADAIAGLDPDPVAPELIPRVTYSRPEVASVGWTEPQARERFGAGVQTTTVALRGNARSLIAGEDGHIKLVHHPEQGILGVHIVGPHATELIAAATPLVAWEALPEELAALVHAHPTVAEALGEAAMAAAGVPFHLPSGGSRPE